MYNYILFIIFAVLILSFILIKNIKIISAINILGISGLVIFTYITARMINQQGHLGYFNNNIYIDSFSLIQLIIISTVSLISAIYSYKYINDEYDEKIITLNKAKSYYILFVLFVYSMLFICVSNNIMGVWIGLEATTLSTAFLIGFNNDELSLEAAWKYIIICSIGIVIGLIGIILFIYSLNNGNNDNILLQWTFFTQNYQLLDIKIVKIAFALIFVGIGTKVGFAPMHTWLSDGHSESPSPISAMMSGILINLALYVIIRFFIIVRLIDGLSNLKYIFIIFGCISLIISTFSILKQNNYKRLLAFSSVENMGIISLGIGFGGYIGIFGALLHSIVHAYAKTLLFLVTGNILSEYKTKRIDQVKCLIKTMPKNSIFLIIGVLVIVGTPPFASFFSEFKILMAGILANNYLAVSIYAFSLLLAFVGFLINFMKMIFGDYNSDYKVSKKDNENLIPLVIALTCVIAISISYSNLLLPIIDKAIMIIDSEVNI